MVRVFANGPGDLGSIPGRVIPKTLKMVRRILQEGLGSIPGRILPKTQKMVLDASLLNTQHYKGTDQG